MRAPIYLIVVSGLCLGLGCTFPEIGFTSGSGGAGGMTGSGGAGASAGGGGVAGSGGMAGSGGAASGGMAGSGGVAGGGMAGGATGGSGGCCDCDGDKHDAKGPPCGGDDCDDGNIGVNPEADYHTEAVDGMSNFDWDCNGTPDKNPVLAIGIKCSGFGLKSACEAAGPAYQENQIPGCGAEGPWGKCVWDGLLPPCKNLPSTPTKMACK